MSRLHVVNIMGEQLKVAPTLRILLVIELGHGIRFIFKRHLAFSSSTRAHWYFMLSILFIWGSKVNHGRTFSTMIGHSQP